MTNHHLILMVVGRILFFSELIFMPYVLSPWSSVSLSPIRLDLLTKMKPFQLFTLFTPSVRRLFCVYNQGYKMNFDTMKREQNYSGLNSREGVKM